MADIPIRLSAPTPTNLASPRALAEGAVADVVARFREAYDARNVDAVVDLFAENGDWRLGPGIFAGKAAIRRVLDWDVRLSPTSRSHASGMGTIVRGNVAIEERTLEQTFEGIPFMVPAITVFELNEAGKIEHARSYYDKLPIFRQVASKYPGIKGWFFRRIIAIMVGQGEKGLERS